jgi:transposase InsO family protein
MTIETTLGRLVIAGYSSQNEIEFVRREFERAYRGSEGFANAIEFWLSANPGKNLQIENFSGDNAEGDVDLEAKLSEWENFYNFNRPHGAFNGKTPYEALRERL